MIRWIDDPAELDELRKEHADRLVLFFYGAFSDAAQRGLGEIEDLARRREDIPVCVVDVQKVKGLHKQYGVESVPTLVTLENGEPKQSVEGVQSSRFYEAVCSGAARAAGSGDGGERPRRVVVYSGPGCPACGRLKTYLRRHGVRFRDVDLARDPRAADELARRSGQMAVPQTDIDGQLVVGFDESKLNRLLGISPERR